VPCPFLLDSWLIQNRCRTHPELVWDASETCVGCVLNLWGTHLKCVQDTSEMRAGRIWNACEYYLGAELYHIILSWWLHNKPHTELNNYILHKIGTFICTIVPLIAESYSTVVLYIRFGVSCPKIPPKNLPNIYFFDSIEVLVRHSQTQKCLQINSNLCINLLWNFKNFLFNRFFYWLTDYLMPSDKRNSITTKATVWTWFLHCSTSLRPEMCLFANCCSSNARIMVLPKLTFVLLYSPFSFPLPRRWQLVVVPLDGFMEDLVTA